MNEKKETAGKIALDLMKKSPDSRDPIEIERARHKDYEKVFFETLDTGKKDFHGDFFIVVITKKEPLMQNVLRNFFSVRKTCPTPDYDQTVYHYVATEDIAKFIWVIPDRETCHVFKDNILQIPDEEKQLLRFVLDFSDGTLYKLCKKLNNEKEESPFLEK